MGRDALREYIRGSLWLLPVAVRWWRWRPGPCCPVSVGPRSPLAFQGTADDARTLLIGITGTMVTVIALLLGLAVVALQLSSTQFSPRLLRNFLRDRPNQIVLSVFVGDLRLQRGRAVQGRGVRRGTAPPISRGSPSASRSCCCSSAWGCWCSSPTTSLHSIQVDEIMRTVERSTLAVIEDGLPTGGEEAPRQPPWAVRIGPASVRIRAEVRPRDAAAAPPRHGVRIRLRPGSASTWWPGTTLAWIWPAAPDDPAPRPAGLRPAAGRGGADRLRAHPGTGPRARDAAARRRGVQGAVPGGQRPVHRDPGRRTPLRAVRALAGRPLGHRTSPATAAGSSSCRPRLSPSTWRWCRADPPLRRRRADRHRGAAAAARQLRRGGRGRPGALRGHRGAGQDHRLRRQTGSRPPRGPRLRARQGRARCSGRSPGIRAYVLFTGRTARPAGLRPPWRARSPRPGPRPAGRRGRAAARPGPGEPGGGFPPPGPNGLGGPRPTGARAALRAVAGRGTRARAPTLRHRASSIGWLVGPGPRPLALRTSSWWTKNSLRLGQPAYPSESGRSRRRARSERRDQPGEVPGRERACRRSASRPQVPGRTSPGPAR